MRARSIPCAAALALSCNDARGIDLERMKEQYRPNAYGADSAFADGRSMRSPPPGTVSRNAEVERDSAHTGIEDARYVEQVPIPLTRELLELGQARFDVFCAACHGKSGDGRSQVAENMRLRPPPSFYDPPLSEFPVGRLFAIVSEGYGLMPSYAQQLRSRERWAVVAYVDVLRLSRATQRTTGTGTDNHGG